MLKLKQKNKKSFLILLLLLLSTLFLLSSVQKRHIIKKDNQYKVNHFYHKNNFAKQNKTINKKNYRLENSYIAILEIPRIRLKQGFYSIDSQYNQVDYAIEVLKQSSMPDAENGNLILAAHNGNSAVSFFKHLHLLKPNDKIYIDYNEIRYEYILSNIYEVKKTEPFSLFRDLKKTTLTLITCKNHNRQLQQVYIAYLLRKLSYPSNIK